MKNATAENKSYELNIEEVSMIDIMSFKVNSKKGRGDYSDGGFYMIKDTATGMAYIGKSKYYQLRLRMHIYNAKRNSGLSIDKAMNNRIEDFKFYKIITYQDAGIDFFTRKLETIIEQYLIKKFKTYNPVGYNKYVLWMYTN